MRYILAVLSIMLFSCSGNNNQGECVRFYDDGKSKPAIAMATVIDSTSYELPWSLSEELTYLIKRNLSYDNHLFLTSSEHVDNVLTASDNPFSHDIHWMRDKFENDEFVVFLELVKHDNINKKSSTDLAMMLRLKIVDLRSGKPKVILQESISDNFCISKSSRPIDYNGFTWDSLEYSQTRMATAHKQLAKTISDRISDYILLAKSR